MMHNKPDLFAKSEQAIEFCKINKLRYLAKPFDNSGEEWAYTSEQFKKFFPQEIKFFDRKVNSIAEGRRCCGGRKLSLNGDLKSNVGFVAQQGFNGWSCSVNWFFLFVRQLDGAVFTNKDCQMSTTGMHEPLGTLVNSDQIINTLRTQLETKTMPVIVCKKKICVCGFCAPKAKSREDFMELIKRNVPVDVFQN
jgi:hypothetical protein